MVNSLEFVDYPPKTGQPASGLIVTLHGWGANAQDVESLLPFFNLSDFHFIFPNAPNPYPYSPTGRAWYDLRMENMYQGLTESRDTLIGWLLALEGYTGIPLSRTILSGFSQGGAMTLDVGLKFPFAGLVSMSGYLHPGAATELKDNFPPALIMHGRQDDVVPLQAAINAKTTLESLKVAVDYHEFEMGHEICPEMLVKLRDFIQKVIVKPRS
jgi:phospholipase/carboxylesterase